MTDFKTKTRTWPVISTGEELSTVIGGQFTVAERWGEYQYRGAAPCHQSGQGQGQYRAFRFGTHPQGGLIMHCNKCLPQGSSSEEWKHWVDAIEERLGCALQIRYSSGNLRYRRNTRFINQAPPSTAQQTNYRKVVNTGLYATPIETAIPVSNILDLPIWFPGIQKKGWTVRHNGQTYGWRQSRPLSEGGVALARFGGVVREGKQQLPLTIKPWRTYAEVVDICNWAERKGIEGVRPVIGLGGDSETLAPHALQIIDVDYKPASDVEGKGVLERDALRARFLDAGMAIFVSNSGNGFHAVGMVHPDSWFDFTNKAGQTIHKVASWAPLGKGSQSETGLAVDLFFPGARYLVALNWNKPGGNNDPSHVLPLLTAEDVNDLLTGK